MDPAPHADESATIDARFDEASPQVNVPSAGMRSMTRTGPVMRDDDPPARGGDRSTEDRALIER